MTTCVRVKYLPLKVAMAAVRNKTDHNKSQPVHYSCPLLLKQRKQNILSV